MTRAYISGVFLLISLSFSGYCGTVERTREEALQGDALAQKNLGTMYANGNGVEQDYEEAVKWYLKAAEQGDAGAQNNLGRMYAEGDGVAQDYEEAENWWRKAAEQGNAGAQRGPGIIHNTDHESTKWPERIFAVPIMLYVVFGFLFKVLLPPFFILLIMRAICRKLDDIFDISHRLNINFAFSHHFVVYYVIISILLVLIALRFPLFVVFLFGGSDPSYGPIP
jgi:tetratricopeptide (TPR) repeat protein